MAQVLHPPRVIGTLLTCIPRWQMHGDQLADYLFTRVDEITEHSISRAIKGLLLHNASVVWRILRRMLVQVCARNVAYASTLRLGVFASYRRLRWLSTWRSGAPEPLSVHVILRKQNLPMRQ